MNKIKYYVFVDREELKEISQRYYPSNINKLTYEEALELYNDYKSFKKFDKKEGINMGVLLKGIIEINDIEYVDYFIPKKYKNKLHFKSII